MISKSVLYAAVIFITFLSACEREKPASLTGVFKARVADALCANVIVEIQDSSYYQYGMDWTNNAGKSYQHVFTVINNCEFAGKDLRPGESFLCKIVTSADQGNCYTCLAVMQTPPLAHLIKVVQ